MCQYCRLWHQYLCDVCVWRHGYPETHSQTDIWFLKHSITAFWIHQRLSARIIVLNKLRYKRNQTSADQITWPVISSAVIESSSDVFHIKPAVLPVHVTNWICHHFPSYCFPGRQGSRWLRNSFCSRVTANCVTRLIVPEEEHEERLSELLFCMLIAALWLSVALLIPQSVTCLELCYFPESNWPQLVILFCDKGTGFLSVIYLKYTAG
jgi:hypothetical protein